MIYLTRLNGSQIVVNVDLIETIEKTPDTVITFTNGKKLVVAETIEIVVEKAVEFKKRIMQEKIKG